MYARSAVYYDLIYGNKNYRAEVERLLSTVGGYRDQEGGTLLDVACGTGRHIEYLRDHFEVTGLDGCRQLLHHARRRCPDVEFHLADMRDFSLGMLFDVVTCLFSAIGHMTTFEDLVRALTRMSEHTAPGGLVVVEPWFTPDTWITGRPSALLVERDDLKVARLNTTWTEGNLAVFELHYLVARPEGVEHFTDRFELGLYETDEMMDAFRQAGLDPAYDEEGIAGRGLYVARK